MLLVWFRVKGGKQKGHFTNELIVAMSICLEVPTGSFSTIGLFRHRRSEILSRSRLKKDFQSLISLYVMHRQRRAGKQSSSFESGSNWNWQVRHWKEDKSFRNILVDFKWMDAEESVEEKIIYWSRNATGLFLMTFRMCEHSGLNIFYVINALQG